MRPQKICVVTGSRAEFGLLSQLMRRLKNDKAFRLRIIATGMHLSPEFGLTWEEITSSGFRIDEKVHMLLSGDDPEAMTKSIGLGIIGLADALKRLSPDMLVVLGDRFETFAAAVAAFTARIPIAHIHGGELTEGALDEQFRHSITKMSMLHFTSTEAYRKRVIQLGEDPSRVFNVGAIGIDAIKGLKLLDRETLESRLGFPLKKTNLLVTFHPVTVEKNASARHFGELLKALDRFGDAGIVFTKPNADTGGRAISEMTDAYVRANQGRAVSFASMGQLLYLSALKHADAVVGNSSSGIIEAPHLGTPTVNIGPRQKGRIRPATVIDCESSERAIASAIRKALSAPFRSRTRNAASPYGDGRASGKIIKILKQSRDRVTGVAKTFYDINQAEGN